MSEVVGIVSNIALYDFLAVLWGINRYTLDQITRSNSNSDAFLN